MNIALIGYGKMGKAVEAIALRRGHTIVLKADLPGTTAGDLKDADVAVEFSSPEAAPGNITTCIQSGTPVVVGTTGWYSQYETLSALCRDNGSALLTATNFSVGVNMLFELNRQLAQMMSRFPDYTVSMEEIHHIHKLDSPSGTALTLAEGIMQNNGRIKSWEETANKDTAADVLAIHSQRIGETIGTHIVHYTSPIDRITIGHEAFTREGFALGAVLAAEWIAGKKGVFTMKDVMGLNQDA